MTFFIAVIGNNRTSKEIRRVATQEHGYVIAELVESDSGKLHITAPSDERLNAVIVTAPLPDSTTKNLFDLAKETGTSLVLGAGSLSPFAQQLLNGASPWAVHAPCAATSFLDLRDTWLPMAVKKARSDLIQSVNILTSTPPQTNPPESMNQLRQQAESACGDLIAPHALWVQDAKTCPPEGQMHTVTVTSHNGAPLTTSVTVTAEEHANGLLEIASQMPNDPQRILPLSYKFTL